MIGRWAAKLAVFLLKHTRIEMESRQLLTTAILDRLGALPIRARIRLGDTGQIFIDEKEMKMDSARLIREGSRSMLRNFARKVVREQLTFMAVKQGVHENISPEQGLFAKAILWVIQEEEELYRTFAGDEIENDQERTL